MKEYLVCCFVFCFSLVITTGAVNQYQAQDCCHRIGVSNKGPGEDGYYRFIQIKEGLPEFCVGGCVYVKEDTSEPDQEFCFYQSQLLDGVSECLVNVLTTTTPTITTTASSTTITSSSTTITTTTTKPTITASSIMSQVSTTTSGSPTTTTASTENDISMLSLTTVQN